MRDVPQRGVQEGSIDSLDQETLFTIQKFFENNLNVSETSRKLFVHRNTLVYRLEKIKKLTGLDLREFDHAIVFKVALMVRKYLASVRKTFAKARVFTKTSRKKYCHAGKWQGLSSCVGKENLL